jgi:crotonobetainyl-CoA:carnitine CoA-transferase CaiB-like acyl-CoA transferase
VASGPLHGVRVLDLSRVIAGPFCTMQLADLGAEIIKIEHPERGDDSRGMKPPEAGGESHFFLAFNRSKKSVALDMATKDGAEIVRALATRSDCEHWLGKLGAAGLPAGPVRSVSEALESSEARERGMVAHVKHPTAGDLRIVGSPYRLSATQVETPTAPPLLGQHTEDVLRDLLGYDKTRIADLRDAKVIRGA